MMSVTRRAFLWVLAAIPAALGIAHKKAVGQMLEATLAPDYTESDLIALIVRCRDAGFKVTRIEASPSVVRRYVSVIAIHREYYPAPPRDARLGVTSFHQQPGRVFPGVDVQLKIDFDLPEGRIRLCA